MHTEGQRHISNVLRNLGVRNTGGFQIKMLGKYLYKQAGLE
jgi:hypothetical protein